MLLSASAATALCSTVRHTSIHDDVAADGMVRHRWGRVAYDDGTWGGNAESGSAAGTVEEGADVCSSDGARGGGGLGLLRVTQNVTSVSSA